MIEHRTCWRSYHLQKKKPHLADCFQDKVCEELDHIFQGSGHPPTMKELNMMKYLERVIKESLRLYPSVPFIARKITQDVQIGN
jgi:cytochrome P450